MSDWSTVVLLVEDNVLIQDLLASALEEVGCIVQTAFDAAEATCRLRDKRQVPQVLVTDVNLGSGPDGWQVARCARDLFPELHVVYITGDSAHRWAEVGVPGSMLITKPFAPAMMVRAVLALLGSSDRAN